MKWFQHDTDAVTDRKLMDLAARWGAEGIGVFWTAVEKIAARVGPQRVDLTLEEDSHHLAICFMGRTPIDRIDAILKTCEDLGLLDRDPITKRLRCMTLWKKLDNFTGGNPEIKKIKAEMERFHHFEVTSKSLRTPTNQPTDQPTDLFAPADLTQASGDKDVDLEISETQERLKNLSNPNGGLAQSLRAKLNYLLDLKEKAQKAVG